VSSWLHPLLGLHGWAAYLLVGALCFGEAAFFLGFVVPGETAAVLGGVLASTHHVSLPAMILVVVVCAIVGDTVGYEVGRHLGPVLLRRRPLKDHEGVEKTRAYLQRRGGPAVFLGRWTALFRAVMPGVAGMSRLRYRTFLAYNALGGLCWGVAFTVLGFAVGKSYKKALSVAGKASYVVLAVVVVAIAGFVIWRKVSERRSVGGPPVAPTTKPD
jgi:membrane-associated protein